MKNKPVKWGFKYWVVADTSGYTVNFDLYTGKESDCSEFGLDYKYWGLVEVGKELLTQRIVLLSNDFTNNLETIPSVTEHNLGTFSARWLLAPSHTG